jgi:hypothetical protein
MKDLIDNEKTKIAAISFFAGIVLAVILFPKKEIETIYKTTTKTETDTIFVKTIDTLYLEKTQIKTKVLRDTTIKEYKPKIRLFTASFPFENGSTKVSGEVLGEVLKMSAINDYSLPVVTTTTTIDNVSTIAVKPKGIYLGLGINSLLQPSAKVSYLDNKYLFSYEFSPLQRVHQISVSKKLF